MTGKCRIEALFLVPMSTFRYFAYGSNLLTSRLLRRCPDASLIGPGVAAGYRLTFSKLSQDGSGKATLLQTGDENDQVFGAVYSLTESDLRRLDEVEEAGIGYDRHDGFHATCLRSYEHVPHVTYIARMKDETLIPYDWYLSLIVAGAREHQFHESYIDGLMKKAWNADPIEHRPTRRTALEALKEAGYEHTTAALTG
jgi:gamma-glutamylcyclotransferase